jgi:hypothetical protein
MRQVDFKPSAEIGTRGCTASVLLGILSGCFIVALLSGTEVLYAELAPIKKRQGAHESWPP